MRWERTRQWGKSGLTQSINRIHKKHFLLQIAKTVEQITSLAKSALSKVTFKSKID